MNYNTFKVLPSDKKSFAGFGSRKTPKDILLKMEQISKNLSELGYTLRSGGAIGADLAFEKTASKKEIFLSKDATKEAHDLASKFHPAWVKLDSYAQGLHARNAMIILGGDLDDPGKNVIETVKKISSNKFIICSDEKKPYPNIIKGIIPTADVKTNKREKTEKFDPLFKLNHTAAKIRADLSRMRRRTWATTKLAKNLQRHLDIYVAWNNGYHLNLNHA